MKKNMLKKCACLLLIGGLFAPVHQAKADFGAVLAGVFMFAAVASEKKAAQKLSETEASEIIFNFFNAKQRETVTSRQLSRALIKFDMPSFKTAFFVLNHRPDETYKALQENLNKLPEDLQTLFKAISEEEFCENIKQLKKETPTIKVEEPTTQESTPEKTEAVVTTDISTEVCNETVSA